MEEKLYNEIKQLLYKGMSYKDIAIEMGKIITCEITKHTEDRTGLIQEVEQKM